MINFDYKCDICGKYILPREYQYGATKKIIYLESNRKRKEYESICTKCNKSDR